MDFNASYRLAKKLIQNILAAPAEEKFRRINKQSQAFQKAMIPGFVEFLTQIGFVDDEEDAHLYYVDESEDSSMASLREAAEFLDKLPELRAREAMERYNKSHSQQKREQEETKRRFLAMIANNQAERAGVKAKTSHSQLPNAGKGANVARLDLSNQGGGG